MNIPCFTLTPDGTKELFYSSSRYEDQCIGHLRGDLGSQGNEFWTTWWPHAAHDANGDEFKQEFQLLVDSLRTNVLLNLSSMRKYLSEHPSPLGEDACCATHGYRVLTEKYAYYVRCTPVTGDYQFYIYCYLKAGLPLATKRVWEIPLIWKMYGHLNIEAETVEEAIALALGPDYPLPDNANYLDDSIEVDEEVLALNNQNKQSER